MNSDSVASKLNALKFLKKKIYAARECNYFEQISFPPSVFFKRASANLINVGQGKKLRTKKKTVPLQRVNFKKL